MNAATPAPDAAQAESFSPVDNEPPLRWQRAVYLAPAGGLGVGRRAVFFALATALPILLWALHRGRFAATPDGESLLQHYGVIVRCLVVVPLLILGEAALHNASLQHFRQFVGNGLVDGAARARFDAALQAARRWRDASLPWVFVVAAVLAWTLANPPEADNDALSWARDGSGIGFGGLWFAYVVRPVYLALLLGWLWRIALLVVLFARIGRVGLDLVPSHPDRLGGLGFIEKFPSAFAPVTFALTAMLASHWAHEVLHHGLRLRDLRVPAAVFVVAWSLLLLAPHFALMPLLRATKKAALPSYAAMVAEQGRQVRRKWIDGTGKGETPLLEPAGIGPVADAAAMYAAVESMRSLPVGKATLAGILVPIAVPMLVVAALQVPLKDLLLRLVKALV